MRPRLLPRAPVFFHQGGWDELILFLGTPLTLFVVLRWLGVRKERREQEEAPDQDEGTDSSSSLDR